MTSRRAILVVEFNGNPRRRLWHEAYLEARRLAASERDVEVIDTTQAGESHEIPDGVRRINLVIRTVTAADVKRDETRAELLVDNARQHADQRVVLGVCPVGKGAESAVEDILATIGSGPRGAFRWVEPATDDGDLYEIFGSWMILSIDRALAGQDQAADSERTLLSELPDSIAQASRLRPDPFDWDIP